MNPLLHSITLFLEDAGIAESTLGRKFNGDARLVADIRNGRKLRARTEKRLREFMTYYGGRPLPGVHDTIQGDG